MSTSNRKKKTKTPRAVTKRTRTAAPTAPEQPKRTPFAFAVLPADVDSATSNLAMQYAPALTQARTQGLIAEYTQHFDKGLTPAIALRFPTPLELQTLAVMADGAMREERAAVVSLIYEAFRHAGNANQEWPTANQLIDLIIRTRGSANIDMTWGAPGSRPTIEHIRRQSERLRARIERRGADARHREYEELKRQSDASAAAQ
jgi:hypothetical protein